MKLNNFVGYSAVISCGFLVRLIFILTSYQRTIAERVEVSTPLTAWKRGEHFELIWPESVT